MTSTDDETLAAPEGAATSAHLQDATVRPGAVFAGRYEVQALLGEGGMGSVYRVRDAKLDEVVALKLLTLHGEHAEERFVSEVRLARRVTHPNVARTHDFGEAGRQRFLTMEYVPGTTLERIIGERAPLPEAEVIQLGHQIAAGLAAAHSAGVVHRDLKPANVLVGEQQRVVITDFGIARAAEQGAGTQTGAMLGTLQYMSPEQVMGQPADERSDLYALGLILYELATGAKPFPADAPMGSALMRLQACPVDPRELGPLADSLASLVLRCLARDPQGRPRSAQQIEQTLLAVLERGPAPTESTMESIAESPSRPYAPISDGGRAVAVLPFVFRGGTDHAYLGDAMAEELIDVLSRTRGLRVLALGATRRFAESRDPGSIGEALSVESIVDGTVQHAGNRVRLSVRMIDADGTQRWSERYEGGLEDVFALQESLGRRVAEELRIELGAAAHGRAAPSEAIESFLRARRLLRRLPMLGSKEALTMLDRALELAPDFAPALGAHAIAAVRAWWGYDYDARSPERAERARRSVLRAQQRAPSLAETQVATAMWEVQGGGFIAGARALGRALELAPTMAEAHQYLGQLQCEAGRPQEGRRRLELALELDPSLHLCRYTLARVATFEGLHDEAQEHMDVLWQSLPGPPVPTMIMRFRLAMYRGDREEAQRMRRHMKEAGGAGETMHALFGVATGDVRYRDVGQMYEQAHGRTNNTRFTTLMRQVGTEVFVLAGDSARALRELTTAADSALIDLLWLERCPLLDPLRGDPAFARAERAVRRRVVAIWK